MTAHRFFADRAAIRTTHIELAGDDAGHIAHVLRLTTGDAVTVCDGDCNDYACRIARIEKGAVTAEIVSRSRNANEPAARVTLYQGLPKADKLETIIQKAVELGVWRVVPIQAGRSVVKGLSESRLARLRKVAEAAAKQCGRGIIPEVAPPMDLADIEAAGDLRLVPWEEERDGGLKAVLRCFAGDTAAVVIGPEGGLAADEVSGLMAKGFAPVTLGRRVLRTETAGAAVLAMILYETGL